MAKNTGPELGIKRALWKTADKLQCNMDAAEYKHVVLGFTYPKYNSDTFDEVHTMLEKQIMSKQK